MRSASGGAGTLARRCPRSELTSKKSHPAHNDLFLLLGRYHSSSSQSQSLSDSASVVPVATEAPPEAAATERGAGAASAMAKSTSGRPV